MTKIVRMKELPREDRPREKCMESGPGVLTNTELLAVILRGGIEGKSAYDLADEILSLSGKERNLLGLCHLRTEDLTRVSGIGEAKAAAICCIVELARRLAKESAKPRIRFTGPDVIAQYLMEDMRHLEQEHIVLLMLDARNGVIKETTVFRGSLRYSGISPREIFVEALTARAAYIVIAHNHPSGDPSPSEDDTDVTEMLEEAAELIGIPLVDHVIIGDNQYFSYREAGLLTER